jgi:hypothetical protein
LSLAAAVMASFAVSNRVFNLPSTVKTKPSIGIALAGRLVSFFAALISNSFVIDVQA